MHEKWRVKMEDQTYRNEVLSFIHLLSLNEGQLRPQCLDTLIIKTLKP